MLYFNNYILVFICVCICLSIIVTYLGHTHICSTISFQFMGRLIQPEEVAKTCLYLATDATYSTGQNILVSGGDELDYGFKHNMEWYFEGS